MVKKETNRKDIDNKHKWNLKMMFESDETWNAEYKSVEQKSTEFSKYQNKILDSANNLLDAITHYMDIDRRLSNLFVYACMRKDEDTSNPYYQTLNGKVENLATKVSEIMSFFEPELLKGNYNKIIEYIKEQPELKEYDFFFKQIYRFKKHVLHENEEKLISSMSKIFGQSNQTAGLLRDSDLKFEIITDENGEEAALTNSNYSVYMHSNNREVRKQAFYSMYRAYENMKNTFASTLSGEVEVNNAIARARKYNDARLMALYHNNIDVSIYDNLIKTVNNNLGILYKYYDLKKEVLKLDELNMYDIYAELIKESDKIYLFEEAKELIINALGVLGEDYQKNIEKAFEEKWIDIYPNEGKRNGAYSWGSYDSRPYILLNYQKKFDDVSTLAHELGHSMHSYYSWNNNAYQNAHYEIFVAEVASIVNELLLYKHMLNKAVDKNVRLTILNKMMELFKSTIYRQTMLAEFEKVIHEKAADGEILTNELLSNIYYDLNKKYFGSNVVVNEEIKYEWARIPHFYKKFYVYQYATGLSAACHIVDNILSEKEKSVENYLEFLKTGGRDYPVELLKIAGVDMNDPKIIESALMMFDETIEEFIKLYNS